MDRPRGLVRPGQHAAPAESCGASSSTTTSSGTPIHPPAGPIFVAPLRQHATPPPCPRFYPGGSAVRSSVDHVGVRARAPRTRGRESGVWHSGAVYVVADGECARHPFCVTRGTCTLSSIGSEHSSHCAPATAGRPQPSDYRGDRASQEDPGAGLVRSASHRCRPRGSLCCTRRTSSGGRHDAARKVRMPSPIYAPTLQHL